MRWSYESLLSCLHSLKHIWDILGSISWYKYSSFRQHRLVQTLRKSSRKPGKSSFTVNTADCVGKSSKESETQKIDLEYLRIDFILSLSCPEKICILIIAVGRYPFSCGQAKDLFSYVASSLGWKEIDLPSAKCQQRSIYCVTWS